YRRRTVCALYDKADVAHFLTKVKPHALELVYRHSPVSPGWIREQYTISHNASENDEMVVTERVNRHHDRSVFNQFIECELPKARRLEAVRLHVVFEVQQRESLANLHKFRIFDVFTPSH